MDADGSTTIDIGGMSEGGLVHLTTGLLQECQQRLVDDHKPRDKAPIVAMNDMLRAAFADPKAMSGQQLSDTLFATLGEVSRRYQEGADELAPVLSRLIGIFQRKGRITVDVKPVPIILDASTNTLIDDTEQVRKVAPQLLEQAEKMRRFRHLDLEDLYDGDVLTEPVAYLTVLDRQVRTDPTRVAMPDGWADPLAEKIASGVVEGLRHVPAPLVEIENHMETPEVHIHEAPQEPVRIDFDRDRHGLIKGATSKPVEA